MGKTLALKAPDGRVAIMTVADGEGYEEKAIASFSATKFVPVSITEIDPATVPQDRTFRDAWSFDHEAKAFDHDMGRARETHRQALRVQRTPLLATLDVEISKAVAKGDSKAITDVEKERQRLRDITKDPRIDAAATVDDLKAITL
ncbi:MAG: hypothetical protein E6Q97_15525 [Desulfurellales bacterium]|nr:MAG: hypothetical protein E6Q97_15525 [Desulfurellales bacterium]